MNRRLRPSCRAGLAAALLGVACCAATATPPVTPQQRAVAREAATAGVPVADLAPGAPDTYLVVPNDTLWDISGKFLKNPWRWPELWGMNLDQVRNPHLIYPGQVLHLDRSDDGRARLRIGRGGDGGASMSAGGLPVMKLSPRVRETPLGASPVASIPLNLIEPFLNEAVVFDTDALRSAPRIVATQEGRVLLSRGDTAYVLGNTSTGGAYRIFREPRALRDPLTGEVLGYEALYVGAAEQMRQGGVQASVTGKGEPVAVPATFVVSTVRREAGIGDRLAPVPAREFPNYVPRAPQVPVEARIVSIYGDGLTAGQNQIVALSRGAVDGLERGHVLALWRAGSVVTDRTDPSRPLIRLPDERHGTLFVFRVFQRVSYALILSVAEPVRPGDLATQP